jgi:hypothetical protein
MVKFDATSNKVLTAPLARSGKLLTPARLRPEGLRPKGRPITFPRPTDVFNIAAASSPQLVAALRPLWRNAANKKGKDKLIMPPF